jgi:hypothetical protein
MNSQVLLHDAILHAIRNGSTDGVAHAMAVGADSGMLLEQTHAVAAKLPAVVDHSMRSKIRLAVAPSLLGAVVISDADKINCDTAAFKKLPGILINGAGRQLDAVPRGGVWFDGGRACSMAHLFQHVEDALRDGKAYAEKVRFASADFVSNLAPSLSEKGVCALGTDLVEVMRDASARGTLFMATSSTLAMFDEYSSRWPFPPSVHDELAGLRIESAAHQFQFKDFAFVPEQISLIHVAASNPLVHSQLPTKFLERMIDAGCDIEARTSKHGFTPLMCAARAGKPSMMKILLDAGADHLARDAGGKSVRDHVELLRDDDRGKRLALSLLQSVSARQAIDVVLKRVRAHSAR